MGQKAKRSQRTDNVSNRASTTSKLSKCTMLFTAAAKTRKEKLTLFSDHTGSLLRRQPGATARDQSEWPTAATLLSFIVDNLGSLITRRCLYEQATAVAAQATILVVCSTPFQRSEKQRQELVSNHIAFALITNVTYSKATPVIPARPGPTVPLILLKPC